MKILHTADWHLGAYVGPQCDDPMTRMANTMKCLDILVETAKQEKPDIILVAGDIFHQAKVWADRALTEVRVAAKYINLLSQFAPVAILYGTPNHDGVGQYETLEQMTPGITYFTEPGVKTLLTNSGPIQVAGLPGFDKGHFRAQFPGLSAEEENQVFSQQLNVIVQGLSAQVDPAVPNVLMAHHTVVGSELDNGTHIFQANEVVLGSTTLDNSNFDLVCLGHIHKAQRVDSCSKPVYYAGSIDAFSFNDEGHEKGFWIHSNPCDFDRWQSSFIETPAREFVTFSWSPEYTADYVAGKLINIHKELVQDKVVRILYNCDSETEKALNKKVIERALYSAGAYYVTEIRPEKVTASVNRKGITEKLTVSECLERYLKEKGKTEAEISAIMYEAVGIIAKARANMPMGSTSGLFLPIGIEVRNYRSYAEEKFSFEDIYFAMVNGRNGSGKSSLFMDAIVDCLYEQPREGELTGWVRNGEKSGSISFTFQLGEDIWRVTRTRQRSGKGTLALAKLEYGQWNDGAEDDSGQWHEVEEWVDHSAERMVDTQKKIVDLLGMDADTFRSCVLIMQDQYGRFMEAKPEERMSVLASLLGLGIYEQLETETKSTLTDVNRDLRNTKEEVLELEEEISQINYLKDDLKNTNEQLETTHGALTLLKKNRDETAAKVATLEHAMKERDRLLREAEKKEADAKNKDLKLTDLMQKAEQTKEFLSKEPEFEQKYKELQETRDKILSMDGKAKLLDDKQKQAEKLKEELEEINGEKKKLEREIAGIQGRLQEYDSLSEQLVELEGSEEELKAQEDKKTVWEEVNKKITITENKLSQNNNSASYLESQTHILKNSNCVDIENAQCGFLKAAKEAVEKLKQLNAERLQIQAEIDELKNTRDSIMYETEAYAKAKSDAERYRQLKQQLAELEGDKKLLEVNNIRYESVIKRIEVTSNEKVRLDTEIHELQKEVQDYERLKVKAAELAVYEEQWKQIPIAKNYLDMILPQIQEVTKELTELKAEAQVDRKKASELAVQVQDYQRHQEELQVLDRSIKDYEETVSHYNKQFGSLEERLKALEEKKTLQKKKQERISILAEKAARLQVLAEAFSQDGIPHQIIRDIIPELETSANEILGQMTGGRMRLEFRTERTLKSNKSKEVATLDIVIIDIDNGELPYLARSGGQKVRAALAVSFALAMVKASRVGLQLGMMFVDEPPFLDAEGVEAYCMALESIHERYPEMRILAISHDENMKARFPQQLTVVTTENGSKVMKG